MMTDKKVLEKAKVEAYIIWYGNQDWGSRRVQRKLAERGFAISLTTVWRWINRWRQGRARPKGVEERMAEIPHVATVPMPKAPPGALTVGERMEAQMAGRVPRARKSGKRGVVKVVEGEPGGVTHEMPVEPKEMPAITWQDILETVPDNRRLALLLADGITARVEELKLERDAYRELYNESQRQSGELREKIEELLTDKERLLVELDMRIREMKVAGQYSIEKKREIMAPEPAKKDSPTVSGGKPGVEPPATTASADQG